MNKIIKISATLLTIMLILMMATSVFALTPADLKGTPPNSQEIVEKGNKIIGIIQTVGIIIAVVILMILGIKYMMGSAEEKAEYKKTMIPYLVGAVCIFAASSLANVIYGFITTL